MFVPSFRATVLGVAALLLQAAGCESADAPATDSLAAPTDRMRADDPAWLVIAHRGASGHRPEHTLEAYALGVELGADYIEPDLVSTKDGVLVARHENEIGGTTDVSVKFPERRTTRVIDGDSVSGWFTEDFTLAELRTLRAKERLPQLRDTSFDGRFLIPTFDEVLALADSLGRARGRAVGVYPETKHPTYFRSIGLPLEAPLIASLTRVGWNRADAPVFIQSFEVGNLRTLARETPVRLIQLMAVGAPPDAKNDSTVPTYEALRTADGLRKLAEYVYGIGPEKRLVLPDGGGETTLVRDAHAAGLKVHVWTVRAEAPFVGKPFKGDVRAEVRALKASGVDGVFADQPEVGR
ncbi:MAG: glycerophosphodiester phosphodiesterase [Gemmatimonadaceae bacterium]|nr:glycerophosphodiester phosphodiesterase [Gemmatimonadaceae bacterium]